MNRIFYSFIFLAISGCFSLTGCRPKTQTVTGDSFTFVFMTDIHLQPESRAVEGFRQAMDSVNKLRPDFVITGGDLIMDALGQSYGRADSLYQLYQQESKHLQMPVYNTMGNHEIYGIYTESNADPNHPEYGEQMFEKRLGKSYYAFEHKGWKFMVLNSIEDTHKSGYIGLLDAPQLEWIKTELATTDTSQPLVIATHIPFVSAYMQKFEGSTLASDSSLVVANSKQVLDLFAHHNLKLVLQGHLHILESIYIDGITFITGGAVCARWWAGPYLGTEEGFLKLTVKGDNFDWKYVDYGWEVNE
ncbi:MAG TPA: metallophosphoesterase [Marinilabiliales bacterium]|nr:metallophosphoesterase [Marinilabiliales bacterium]HBO73252.1 metallophosphoesterase [Marinilabiliales bacterium]HBX84529.1 metallophosphoesterase [Marinilabiliales bacterium]HBY53594.1 metallophosphoesterase [Marinilabiliales bacterium]